MLQTLAKAGDLMLKCVLKFSSINVLRTCEFSLIVITFVYLLEIV